MKKFYLPAFLLSFLLCGSVFSQGTITRISQLDMPNNGSFDIWAYEDSATGIEYALLGSNGLVVVDVSDPYNPVQVAWLDSIPHFDIKVWKNYAYTVTGGAGGFGNIIDLSDPLNPAVIDSFPSAHNIWIDDNGYLYSAYPGLTIYNLNPDPTNPDSIFSTGTGGHDVFVKGNLLYDFHGTAGTNIYNISNPNNPILLCNITDPAITYHHSGWVTEDDNHLFILDELADSASADITVWNISDFNNASKVGSYTDTFATVHNMFVEGDYAFVSYYAAGFRVFDISDPANPVIDAEYDTNPASTQGYYGAFGVYIYSPSGYIYVHDRDSGLFIFSYSPPPADTSGVPDTSEKQDRFVVYPNPSDGEITIEFFYTGRSDLIIRVMNQLGQVILEETKLAHTGLYEKTFYLSSISAGEYHVQIITGIEVFSDKIFIE